MMGGRHATLYQTPDLQTACFTGGIPLHRARILDVAGPNGLVAELARMVEDGVQIGSLHL
jgi:hypothetical protein